MPGDNSVKFYEIILFNLFVSSILNSKWKTKICAWMNVHILLNNNKEHYMQTLEYIPTLLIISVVVYE